MSPNFCWLLNECRCATHKSSQAINILCILPSGKPRSKIPSNRTESYTFTDVLSFDIRINLIWKSTCSSRTCHKTCRAKSRESKCTEGGPCSMTEGHRHCAGRNQGGVSLRETNLAICLDINLLTSRNFNVLVPVRRAANRGFGRLGVGEGWKGLPTCIDLS